MTETTPLPRRGRPPLLTADKIKPLADAVERGESRAEAARSVGVAFGAFVRWLGEGRRLHDSAVPSSALAGQEWLCLRLFRTVEEAEKRRDMQAGLRALSTVPRALLEKHMMSMPANPVLSVLPSGGPEIVPRLDLDKLPPGTRVQPFSAAASEGGRIVTPWPDAVIEVGRPRGPVRRWLRSLLERAVRAL